MAGQAQRQRCGTSSKESVYWDELSDATASLALAYAENNELEVAKKIALFLIFLILIR